MADERTICSLEQMKSLFAEATAVPVRASGGTVEILCVDELRHAGEMAALMDGLIHLGWEFKGGVVLRRLARADSLLASIADGPLNNFCENPHAPNLSREVRRQGWKLSNASRIHGHRARAPGVPVPRLPILSRLGNSLRRLARYTYTRMKTVEYLKRRCRLLIDNDIPTSRASKVVLTYPTLPLPLGATTVSGSSASTSTGSSSSTSGSSTGSLSSCNSNCSDCLEGRPHRTPYHMMTCSSSSTSTDPSSGSSAAADF